jgi:hypothetical protein
MPVEGLGADVACEQLAADVARWHGAYELWLAAVRQRQAGLERADRRVLAATGGLRVAKWRAACRRRRIATVQDAKLRAKALRARPAVEEALVERERVAADSDEAVLVARLALAEASKRVVLYGPLGTALTGLSADDLRRLARRPARGPSQGQRSAAGAERLPMPLPAGTPAERAGAGLATDSGGDALEAFIGSGASKRREPFDIHQARAELAGHTRAEGT